MNTVAAVIAIYAAVVATGSLVWQIFTWRHKQRSRVEVSVRIAIAAPAPGVTQQAISITAANRSEHAVRVTSVGLDLNRDDGWQFHQAVPILGASLPGIVQPHDAGVGMIDRENAEEEGLDLFQPVVAWIRLSTGEICRSNPTRIIRPD